jgi:hypothetical protein
MYYEGIAKSFENLEYVKPPNYGTTSSALEVFSMMGVIAKSTHLMYVVHMGGLDQTIGSR